MRKVVTGEQVAQLYNRDPFALPVWCAPVYRTPFGIILLVKLARLLAWLVRLAVRHPAATGVLAILGLTWVNTGWPGVAGLAAWVAVVLTTWRYFWPSSFTRCVGAPLRGSWRAWWCYRRRWAGVIGHLRGRPALSGPDPAPRPGHGHRHPLHRPVQVRLVSGQSAADVAKRAENLAHGFGAMLCRVRTARSGAVVLEFVRRDALALTVPAIPVPDRPDLTALPVGRREDGLPWLVKLHGTHVLVAGATGAGKASLLWD
jgi:S-DNA-T family DNA segregation ATPase FtsK/SpoIIIE